MDRIRHKVLALGTAALLALTPAAAGVALAEDAANNDTYVMNENGTIVVDAPGLLANDSLDAGTPCVAGIDAQNVMGHLGDMANTGWRSDGSFEFTPYESWNGETSFIYGMTDLDADNTCVGAALDQGIVTITVRPVNDAPTAVLVHTCQNTVRVLENSGPYDDPEHCTEMHNWGQSLDENTQSVEAWVVTTDRPELFSDGPSVRVFDETYGTLHFTPARGASGLAEVTVRGRDSGGTERGGQDLSNRLTFTIRIVAKSDPTPTAAPPSEPPMESEQPSASADLPSSDEPTSGGATPEQTETTVPGAPTGFADGAPMLIALVFVIGIIAIGAGILAPRLIRRSRETP